MAFSIFQEIYKVIQEEEYFCYTLSQKIHIHHIQSPSKVGSLLWLIKLPQSPRSQKLWRSNLNKTGHNLPNKINLYTHMYLVIQGRQWMELEGHEFTKLWTQKWSQVKCLHSLSFKYTPLKPPSCTWSRESIAQHIFTRFQRKLHNNALKVCHLVNSLHTNTCTAHEWVWFVITKHQTIAIIRNGLLLPVLPTCYICSPWWVANSHTVIWLNFRQTRIQKSAYWVSVAFPGATGRLTHDVGLQRYS